MKPSEFLLAARGAPDKDPGYPSLNELQLSALNVIASVNLYDDFRGMFYWSTIMAICQIESNFRPHAYRLEPSGVASYGLMQVLDVTAGYDKGSTDAQEMFDPAEGIYQGLLYLKSGYQSLLNKDMLSYDHLFAGYNEGYGAVERGRLDDAYVALATKARDHYLFLDEVQTAWNNSPSGYGAEITKAG